MSIPMLPKDTVFGDFFVSWPDKVWYYNGSKLVSIDNPDNQLEVILSATPNDEYFRVIKNKDENTNQVSVGNS